MAIGIAVLVIAAAGIGFAWGYAEGYMDGMEAAAETDDAGSGEGEEGGDGEGDSADTGDTGGGQG